MPLLDKKNEYFFVLLIVFLSVAISHSSYPLIPRVAIIGCAALGLIFHELLRNHLLWSVIAGGFLISLFSTYSIAANHTFLCAYLALSATLQSRLNDLDFRQMTQECRIYIFIVMFFATIHKLITPYYTSGELIADYVLTGNTLSYLFNHYIPEFYEIISRNNLSNSVLFASSSPTGEAPAVIPTEIIPLVRIISWSGIAHEAIVSALMIIPLERFSKSRFWILLLLLVGIYVLRNETAFLSLITFLGMWLFRDSSWKWRTFLVVLAYFCFCTLSGYRPYFLG